MRDTWDNRKDETLEPPQDPKLVVEAIVESLDDPRTWIRIPVGADALRILELRDQLSPDAWSRMSDVRNGLTEADTGEAEVLTPQQVLDFWGKRRKNAKWKKAEQSS